MEALQEYWPFLAPIFLIQLGLVIFALVDLVRREQVRGPKWLWAIVIIVINFIGPIAYLVAGREEA